MAEEQGITAKKEQNFSEWYTQVIQKAELADIRYNVKGFIVFQPWSVLSMEKMYKHLEKVLQKKGHNPYWFPTVIPERNFKMEASHIEGFTPEVFWVTSHGDNDPLEEKLALRPTSETAFYQMFSLWIRSHKDLPFKTYQRAQVFRYETKATRPFLRSREFHWIETHCAHATKEDAMKQVYEDMATTQEVLHDIYGLPFMFFERPEWDKFPGAERTFAADVLNPDGRVVQQPSTHLLKQSFAKAFNVKYKDKEGKDIFTWITCYGPAISRIFASVIIVHGDDKGLRFPWKIAPKEIVIAVIRPNEALTKKAEKIKEKLEEEGFSVEIDISEKSMGEKFYFWEMKGIPVRIELGEKELNEKKLGIFRRDTAKKEKIDEKELVKTIKKISQEYDKNLIEQADQLFKNKIITAKDKKGIKQGIEAGKIVKCEFCTTSNHGKNCAEWIEKEAQAFVRGTKLDETEKTKGSCVICGKKSTTIVYIARSY
ncbi:proline--tRNA ligase [Candidatus Woesearchaeota archaeon]|nr:proline--tRNA ligase [Candidatus Woesearchaeota archaeon]